MSHVSSDSVELAPDNAPDQPAAEPAGEVAPALTPATAPPSAADPASHVPPPLTPDEQRAIVARALDAADLPRGLRERLRERLAPDGLVTLDAAGEPLVRIAEVAAVLREAMPPAWQLDRRTLTRPEHPEGAAFFTGDDEAASDARAEQIARGQLARSGFLKR